MESKGWLRQAIEGWFKNIIATSLSTGYGSRVIERSDEIKSAVDDTGTDVFAESRRTQAGVFAFTALYAFTGFEAFKEYALSSIQQEGIPDVSSGLADVFRMAFDDPAVRELTEVMGSVVTEPILALFEQYAGRDDVDPKEFARAFHGFMSTLTLGGGVADTLLETVSAGQIEGAGRMLQGMYWSLGLGFLGWQTLAPLLSSGLQPGLERYYKRLYRPERFSAGDLRDLYALGEISQDEIWNEARTLGWRDKDIEQWIRLAFRALTTNQVFELYHAGKLSQAETVARLRAQGYDPEDIPYLFDLNPREDVSDAKTVSLSTAKSSYKEHLISKQELQEILSDLGKSDQEVHLIVDLLDLQIANDLKSLSTAQIKAAWEDNILSDPEARHWLTLNGFGDEEINIIIETWKVTIDPPFRKLNKGTILGAYLEGILDRTQAAGKLEGIGLSPDDARLELDLVEARNPELFGRPAARPTRTLTLGKLEDMLAAGLITADDMRSRLVTQGYPEADADLLVTVAVQKAEELPRPLSQSTIEDAYLVGVLDRNQSFNKLRELEFTEEDARTILDTVEAENPGVFHPESVQSFRIPSISSLVEAFRNGILDSLAFFARAEELGYTRQDAEMFIAVAQAQERKGAKRLTQAQIANAYGAGIFTRADAMLRLTALGYTEFDADVILRLEKDDVLDTEAFQNALSGIITVNEAIDILISQGYPIEDIENAFEIALGG